MPKSRRLRELVRIASYEGCLVALKTQIGCMTEDPDTATVLCDNVKGLGLALDPSHYITGPRQGRDFSKVIPYVMHVHLRDSTKSELQVRVGQGEVDYGKLVSQLENEGYKRALSVHLQPAEGLEHPRRDAQDASAVGKPSLITGCFSCVNRNPICRVGACTYQ